LLGSKTVMYYPMEDSVGSSPIPLCSALEFPSQVNRGFLRSPILILWIEPREREREREFTIVVVGHLFWRL
jgi:hypothetical protein